MIFRSLRLSILLLGAIGVLASIAMAIQGYLLQSRMSQQAGEVFVSKDVVADILPPPLYLIELRLVLSEAVEGTLTPDAATKEFDRLVSEYDQRVAYWTKNPPYGLEKQLLGEQHAAALKFIAAARIQILAHVQSGDLEGARHSLSEVNGLYLEHRTGVNKTVEAGNKFADVTMAAFDSTQAWSARIMLTVTAVAAALVLMCYRIVLTSITVPLEACTRLSRQMANGDLSSGRGAPPPHDSIGELARALSDMKSSLTLIVGSVRENADSVATASAQISSGNNDLASRTEEQASALQETAASMEELGATVRQNTNSAQQADHLAQSATAVAEKGSQVVSRVVDTMKGINDSSKKIADIIGVIDGIAFQTNILALNAAVEAARAGEQGRGFAVVASEVRSLASRSADAAKEIKSLIGTSVTRVEQGSTLVDQAGSTMSEVVNSIQQVSRIMGEISLASAQQSSGVAQIGDAIDQMDRATQQNSALVEESAAAAESLKVQAQQLVSAVAVFKLTEGT